MNRRTFLKSCVATALAALLSKFDIGHAEQESSEVSQGFVFPITFPVTFSESATLQERSRDEHAVFAPYIRR